ncbi:MAG TPA: hypothetical protein VIE44_20035 [Methylomirabilota bacterium]|jgi:hypothetical protein
MAATLWTSIDLGDLGRTSTRRAVWSGLAALVAILGLAADPAYAHGLAGRRFFPATLAIEDPFVADELALPAFSTIKTPEGRETSIGGELAKSITPSLGVSVGAEYLILDPSEPEEPSADGFGNPELGVKYVLFKSDAHESIVSLAFDWEIGGVGKEAVGASQDSTIGPSLLFGQGLGDLPDALAYLRPLAVTGVFGAEIPFADDDAIALTYGIAIEYSLRYLQNVVKDVGLPRFVSQISPIVELVFETPIEGEEKWKTTGTVNPGLIWAGKYVEVGVEAIIPINQRTGKDVGVRALLHFFLDDLWPTVFHPIFQ